MSEKTIVWTSSDGESFEINEVVALQSQMIANFLEEDIDSTTNNEFKFPNITSEILALVIDYCKKHVDGSLSEEDLKKWDAEFMKIDDVEKIFDLIMAANYLNIKSLLDLTCQTIADMIASMKTPEEVREKFKIENDFTPEEEEALRMENQTKANNISFS